MKSYILDKQEMLEFITASKQFGQNCILLLNLHPVIAELIEHYIDAVKEERIKAETECAYAKFEGWQEEKDINFKAATRLYEIEEELREFASKLRLSFVPTVESTKSV